MQLFGQVWLWSLLSFVLGVGFTWLFLLRPAARRIDALETEVRELSAPRFTNPPVPPPTGPEEPTTVFGQPYGGLNPADPSPAEGMPALEYPEAPTSRPTVLAREAVPATHGDTDLMGSAAVLADDEPWYAGEYVIEPGGEEASETGDTDRDRRSGAGGRQDHESVDSWGRPSAEPVELFGQPYGAEQADPAEEQPAPYGRDSDPRTFAEATTTERDPAGAEPVESSAVPEEHQGAWAVEAGETAVHEQLHHVGPSTDAIPVASLVDDSEVTGVMPPRPGYADAERRAGADPSSGPHAVVHADTGYAEPIDHHQPDEYPVVVDYTSSAEHSYPGMRVHEADVERTAVVGFGEPERRDGTAQDISGRSGENGADPYGDGRLTDEHTEENRPPREFGGPTGFADGTRADGNGSEPSGPAHYVGDQSVAGRYQPSAEEDEAAMARFTAQAYFQPQNEMAAQPASVGRYAQTPPDSPRGLFDPVVPAEAERN